MNNKNLLRGGLVISAALLLNGCAAYQAKQIAGFDAHYGAGAYGAASDFALKKAGDEGKDPENLLWTLQAAAALRAGGEYPTSNTYFDHAEKLMKSEDGEHVAQNSGEQVAATLVNDSLLDYEPAVYDGVMVNTFKALNMLAMGDMQNARIELNRADDRQRRAVEAFEAQIKKREQELAKEKEEGGEGADVDQSLSKAEEKAMAALKLERWEAYPDFVNPFTSYVNGLFFLLAHAETHDKGDLEKSRSSFERVAGMMPENQSVRADLKLANDLQAGKKKAKALAPTVWVVFENGEGPIKREQRIDFPVYLVSSKALLTSIALPKIEPRQLAAETLSIKSGKKQYATETVADMDRVVSTEFKKDFKYVLTRAVTGAVIKTLAQAEAKKRTGIWGGLAAAAVQRLTTEADQRSWSALPKQFQVARFERPADGEITLEAKELGQPIKLALPDARFNIVYVKAPRPGAIASHTVMSFPREQLVSQR